MFKGHRTRILAGFVGILGIVDLAYADVINDLVPETYKSLVLMGIAIAIFVLRQLTTTPPGVKE